MTEELTAEQTTAEGEAARELEALAFLPPLSQAVRRVVPALLAVGLVLFIPFGWFTEQGRQQVQERGVGPVLLGWAGMLVLLVLGALLGLAIARALGTSTRRFRRVEVLRLAVGESVVAAAGTTFVAVLVAGGSSDLLRVLAIAFVLTFLFSWAMLLPLYRQAWDAAAS